MVFLFHLYECSIKIALYLKHSQGLLHQLSILPTINGNKKHNSCEVSVSFQTQVYWASLNKIPFSQSNNIPFYFQHPHNELSVASFLANKSVYLPINSCMYLITNNCNHFLLVKLHRVLCLEFLLPSEWPWASVQKRMLPLCSIFLNLSFCFPLCNLLEFLLTSGTSPGPQQLTWEVKLLQPMDY